MAKLKMRILQQTNQLNLANQMLTAKTTTSAQEIVSKIYGSRL
jgi:hypothetical protein